MPRIGLPQSRVRSRLLAHPQECGREKRMLRCTFSEFVAKSGPAEIAAALSRLEQVKIANGSRAATDQLFEEVGVASWKIVNDSYYEEALHYYLGLLHAHLRQPELAAEHIALSHTTPAAGGDVVYELHCRDAKDLAARQGRARARGLPSLLLASMPRSASTSLTQYLSRLFDVPLVRLSAGRFPDYFLLPSWLHFFLTGGAITHDHFGATHQNLQLLESAGVRQVFVVARDPRAAAASYARMVLRGQADSYAEDKPFEDLLLDAFRTGYAPWLRQWLDYDRAPHKKMSIHWLTYAEVCREPSAVLKKIGAAVPEYAFAAAAAAVNGEIAPAKVNFVEGDDDAWRRDVSPETIDRLWNACTADMIGLLDLKR
jgi:hypothetical protein